jgi:hypothetical protein
MLIIIVEINKTRINKRLKMEERGRRIKKIILK